MTKSLLLIILGIAIATAGFFVYSTYFQSTPLDIGKKEETSEQEQIVGNDLDEHGCKGSAGYSWCEVKQKCLKTWEEPCQKEILEDESSNIKTQIKNALIAKHGQTASNLTITVSVIEGNYAKGGASEQGMGGGMWFAAKVGNDWKLVWDGNGIINCSDLTPYSKFPASLIPECFDESTNNLRAR